MARHSSTLAWKFPWMEKPGRLQSMGLLRVGHDWATSLSILTFTHWRRKWQPTPVFLPGESQGRGSLVGCRLWGHTVGHNWSDLAAAAAAGNTLCTHTQQPVDLTWPHRDRKTPLLNQEEELIMEVWCQKRQSLFPLPTFPLIIKL